MKVIQGLAILVLLTLLPWSALAGTQDEALVALHCPRVSIKGDPCTLWSFVAIPCAETDIQSETLLGWHAWLFVARADQGPGVSGLSFGVAASESLAVFRWYLCADSEIQSGAWPQSGGGNRLVWDPEENCQREVLFDDGVYALAGAFYIYAYGDSYLEITPNEAEGETVLMVTDCDGQTSVITAPGGRVGFGNAEGYNPCLGDVPVVQKTWGRIKAQYD